MDDRPLSNATIIAALEFHDIEYKVRGDNIMASEIIRDEDGHYKNWTDVTEFSLNELKSWLGYTS